MGSAQSGAVLLAAGSVLFLVGAAIGVPRVFTEPDPDARLRMLDAHRFAWRLAQPMYGGGALVAAAGVGPVAAASGGASRALLVCSCSALVAGASAWCWSVAVRGVRVEEWALGRLPGWPFTTYLVLTFAGLALLGVGVLVGDFPGFVGWLVLVADAVYLAAYLRFRDLPPFLFYVLFLVVAAAIA